MYLIYMLVLYDTYLTHIIVLYDMSKIWLLLMNRNLCLKRYCFFCLFNFFNSGYICHNIT